jgi:sugar phosphate permease
MVTTEVIISFLILLFVIGGAIYDVELSPEGRCLHSRAYRWRRLRNWFPMGIAYAAFYMARYNVAAGNISSVRDQLHLSGSFIGWVISSGSWAYAASAPFTGQITDRIGGKNGMIVACLGAALCNLGLGGLFSIETSLFLEQILFVVLYASNVLLQGFGTSAVVKINAAWYSASERGLFAGVFNIMLTSGYFLALGAGSSIINVWGWEYVFYIPGIILLVMTFGVVCFVQNYPPHQSLFKWEVVANQEEISSIPIKSLQLNKPPATEQMKRLLSNYTFLGYLASVFFLCWARDGFLNWLLSFIDAVRADPLTTADDAIIGGAWTIGGFVGGILCGWISDCYFDSDRVVPIFIFSILQAVILGITYIFSSTCAVEVLGILVFISSVFVLGNYTLLSYTVPSDLPQDIAAGAAGIMTAVGYFSTGLSGAFMGTLIENGGYLAWIFSLMVASILAGTFTALGSYFSSCRGIYEDDDEFAFILNRKDSVSETTPLSSSRSRRASIVRLSTDFIASPMHILPQTTTKSFQ